MVDTQHMGLAVFHTARLDNYILQHWTEHMKKNIVRLLPNGLHRFSYATQYRRRVQVVNLWSYANIFNIIWLCIHGIPFVFICSFASCKMPNVIFDSMLYQYNLQKFASHRSIFFSFAMVHNNLAPTQINQTIIPNYQQFFITYTIYW